MKKSENSQKNEPGKSYKLNCSLHNFDNTNLLENDLFIIREKKNEHKGKKFVQTIIFYITRNRMKK